MDGLDPCQEKLFGSSKDFKSGKGSREWEVREPLLWTDPTPPPPSCPPHPGSVLAAGPAAPSPPSRRARPLGTASAPPTPVSQPLQLASQGSGLSPASPSSAHLISDVHVCVCMPVSGMCACTRVCIGCGAVPCLVCMVLGALHTHLTAPRREGWSPPHTPPLGDLSEAEGPLNSADQRSHRWAGTWSGWLTWGGQVTGGKLRHQGRGWRSPKGRTLRLRTS